MTYKTEPTGLTKKGEEIMRIPEKLLWYELNKIATKSADVAKRTAAEIMMNEIEKPSEDECAALNGIERRNICVFCCGNK
jgi:hypothetical protein